MTTKPGKVRRWLKTQIPSCNYNAPEYVLASDYDAAIAAKDAEIARLREGLGKIHACVDLWGFYDWHTREAEAESRAMLKGTP